MGVDALESAHGALQTTLNSTPLQFCPQSPSRFPFARKHVNMSLETSRDLMNVTRCDYHCALQVLVSKYGEDVHIRRFGKPQIPWWAQYAGHHQQGFSTSFAVPSVTLSAAVEEFLDGIRTKMLWERYEL
jgi:hypothetical protein